MLTGNTVSIRCLRNFAAACWISVCICRAVSGQTADDKKNEFVKKVLQHCGGDEDRTYYLGPLPTAEFHCDLNSRTNDCKGVLEFKNAVFSFDRRTAADILNGRYVLTMSFLAHRSRVISRGVWGAWGEWQDMRPEPWYIGEFLNSHGSWSSRILVDFQPAGSLGAIFEAIKPGSELTVDQAERAKASCEDLKNDLSHGASTPEPPPPPKTGIDGFKYLTAIPRQERQYSGTPEGFAKAFPDFMQRAASASGLNVRNYEKEVAYIVAAAQACSEITTQMALTAPNRTDFSRFGAKYEACRSTINVSAKLNPRTFDASRQRGLVLNVNAYGQEPFSLSVLFSRLSSESPSPDPASDYMIIEAGIGKAPPPNDGGFKFLTALPIQERQYNGTVEGFAKALPDFVQRATTLGGLNFQDYTEDVARIIDVARACGEITPQIAPTLPKFNPSPHPASRYEPCMGTNTNISNLRTRSAFDARHQRGLMLQVSPLGGDWRSGQGFVETVRFDNLTFDTYPDPEPGKPIKRPSRDDYIIVRANIQPLGQNSTGLNSGGLNRPATAGNVNNAGGGRLAPSPASPLSQSALQVEPSIQEKKLIKKTPPLYPALARNAAIQGTVKLVATIGTDGLVKEVQLVSGPPLLVASVMTAVRQWQYEPTLINGSPVAVVTTVAVIFTLP